MKQVQFSEIIGKVIRWNKYRFGVRFNGQRLERYQIPDGHHDYKVLDIEDAYSDEFVRLVILIDDDTEADSILLPPHEINMLLLGVPVRLLSGGTYTIVQ